MKVYIYKRFERFWHWTQSSLIFFLAFTGFEIHDSFRFFGFQNAVLYHRIASYALLTLFAFAIFWHLSTGEWKQYIPKLKLLKVQIRYYTVGIFKHEPHPTKKTVLSKLNPLQALVYVSFKIFLVPVMVISGLFYMFHSYIDRNNIVVISDIKLETIALWHTFGAFLLLAFVIVHVYMTTTGHSVTSNIKAMITGFEDLEEPKVTEDENKKELLDTVK